MMKRALAVVAALVALSGCTPRELRMWQDWHATDPDAAVAFAKALPAEPVVVPLSGKWQAIAYCESGGQWAHRPVTNRSGTFSGGLMIMHSVWRHYGGTEFAPAPYLASQAAQVVVAERIRADVGLSAWQCA